MGVYQIRGSLLGVPTINYKDCSMLRSTVGSPYLEKVPRGAIRVSVFFEMRGSSGSGALNPKP